ncbi:MFS transporter [Robbsia sp. KACC 23696]|uniref:MFS transporter n=1 Tax=Robbsia sp. KACC 23696 TaxID=3149231 RepID=UPI00325BC9CA
MRFTGPKPAHASHRHSAHGHAARSGSAPRTRRRVVPAADAAAANSAESGTTSARRVAMASTIGTIAEYYDFFVYGTAAALVFGKLFFPSSDAFIGTIAAFASFAVGFVARPIGGMVFGHYGDRLGRKKAMVVTILIVGIGTVVIGLLPTYAQIGPWAPAVLILVRVLQGFGVGGEQAGAVLMTAEYAPPQRRGLMTSLVQLGAPAGFLIPSALFAVLTGTLSSEQFLSWGWRIPFLASALLVVIGLYIRLRIHESPAFTQIREAKTMASAPLRDVLRDFPSVTARGLLAKLVETVSFTFYSMVVLAYGKVHGIPSNVILRTIIIAVIIELFTIPLAGWLTDRIGRRPVFIAGATVQLLLIWPFFHALETGGLALQLAMIVALPIGHALCFAPQASLFPELFPTRVRCSGIALIWQTGSLVGGGVFSVLAIKLVQMADGEPIELILYIAVICVVSIAALLSLPETAPGRRSGATAQERDLHDWGALPQPGKRV